MEIAGALHLPSRVAVYIPSTVAVNVAADTEAYIEKFCSLFSGMFGGATATKARGAWQSASSGLVFEEINIVYSYCDASSLESNIETVLSAARAMKSDLGQEGVSLEINNELFII